MPVVGIIDSWPPLTDSIFNTHQFSDQRRTLTADRALKGVKGSGLRNTEPKGAMPMFSQLHKDCWLGNTKPPRTNFKITLATRSRTIPVKSYS